MQSSFNLLKTQLLEEFKLLDLDAPKVRSESIK